MAEKSQVFTSRQVMNDPDFEIFHYHDARMQPVPIHHHDFCEIYLFLSGDVRYLAEGRTYDLRPGALLLLPPMCFHQPLVSQEKMYERFVLWIREDFLRDLAPDGALTRCFMGEPALLSLSPSEKSDIYHIFQEILRERDSGEEYGDLTVRGLLLQLLSRISRIFLGKSREDMDGPVSGKITLRVLSYIGEHFPEDLSLEKIASEFFVSKYYLSHVFKEEVGTSIYRYLLLKRLAYSEELLKEGLSPKEVQEHCGFRDYTAFYRAFREEFGISPRTYQKELGTA